MNKRGLIGKIFLIIGIIILIILLTLGITAYQAYRVYSVAEQEQKGIATDIEALTKQGDCNKVDSIQTRFSNIKKEADNACKNPIIRIAVKKFMEDKPMKIGQQNISINCENLNEVYTQMTSQFAPIKELCTNRNINKTITSQK